MVVVVEDGPRIRVSGSEFVQTLTHVTLLFNEAPTLTIVFRHGSYHLPLHLSTETKWHFLAQCHSSDLAFYTNLRISNMTLAPHGDTPWNFQSQLART